MKMVRPSSAAAFERHLAEARVAQPTYEPIGATLVGERPHGFHHLRVDLDLGRGQPVFERAVVGLKTWQAHALPFFTVHPGGVGVEEGETTLMTIGLRPVSVAVPCRIVAVVDEPARWGFAYGTLPGHLEQGEESFVITRDSNDAIRFEISSYSRPADALMRLLGPLGRFGQRMVTRRYLRALRTFVQAR